jgi:hypothetical protein
MTILILYWFISMVIIHNAMDDDDLNYHINMLFAPLYLLVLIGKSLSKYHDK